MSQNGLILTLNEGVRLIKFNNPRRKNALTQEMYKAITQTLISDATNDSVVITIITGTGDYYSSGNDFKAAMENPSSHPSAKEACQITKQLIQTLIEYPKLLIAVVNGPAIGVAATTAALCDIIYASDTATFATPFINLGLCAEGCSSVTFPKLLGKSKTSEMLFLGQKLTAMDAYRLGFVAEVIPHKKITEFVEKLGKFGKLPVKGVKINKKLLSHDRRILCECNEREMEQLIKCFESDEFFNNLTTFMTRKSKL